MTNCAPDCGQCCMVIGIAMPPETFNAPESSWTFNAPLELIPMLRHEMRFIRDRWHPVSREQAIAINPHMATPHRERDSFYTCDAYDPGTRRCTAYEDRPNVCRDFPFRTIPPHPHALTGFPQCSYWAEIPRSLWPEGTQPLPSPVSVC